jgi:ATP-dependent Clp protease adaptor protein ClpS
MVGEAMPKRETQDSPGVATRTRTKEKLQCPPLYKVLLHNDDYTTMEFVVWLLQSVFHHDEASATEVMLHVHRNGIGVAGVYPYEIAETRVARVETLAREHEYPLRCTLETE